MRKSIAKKLNKLTAKMVGTTVEEFLIGKRRYPKTDLQRPRTRLECPTSGPCPWVGCRHHLYLDVNPDNGTIKYNTHLPLEEMRVTCSLDVVADNNRGLTTDQVGEFFDVTGEYIRQIEIKALLKLQSNDTIGDLK